MSLSLALALAVQDAPIVVTGRGRDEPAGGHTLLLGEDAVDQEPTGRLEGVLSKTAGLSFFRRADARSVHPTSQGLTARGLGGNAASRVAVTLDGVPQADPFGGWINPGAFDPATLGRVIIGRGARPQPGAIGGVVALESPTAGPRTASLAYASHDSWDASALWGARLGDGLFTASAGWMRSDGFVPIVAQDRGAADRGAASNQKVGRLRLAYPVGNIEAQLGLSAFDDRRDRGLNDTDNRARGLDLSARLVADAGAGAGAGWSLTGWWQRRDFETRFAATDDDRASSRLVLDQYDVPASGAGLRGEIGWNAGALTGRVGAEWRHAKADVAERFFFVDGAPTRERQAGGVTRLLGLFASAGSGPIRATIRGDEWRFSDGYRTIDRIGGTRLEDSQFASRSAWHMSGRLDAAHRVKDGLTLRAAAARAVRTPTLNELVRPFRVGADATAANEALAPETSDQIEVGVDVLDGQTGLSATLFAARLDEGIFNVPLSMGPGLFPGVGFVAPGATYSQRQNLSRVTSEGLELDAWKLWGPVALKASYAFSDPELTDGPFAGNLPPQVSRHMASISLGSARRGRGADVRVTYASNRYEDLANQEPLGDAFSLDAAARWPLSRRLSIEVRGTNLTGERVLAGFASDGARERTAPRTFWIGLNVRRD